MIANNASTPAKQQVVSRDTCGSILEKDPLHAVSAVSLAGPQAV